MPQTPQRPLTVLLLGNYRPTIALVRALAAVGHRVVVGTSGQGSAEFSRCASEVWRHPSLEREPDAVLAEIRTFLARRPDVRAVWPVSEEFVRLVSANGNALPADRTYVTPDAGLVSIMMDKVAAYRLAADVGLPVEPWARVERYDDLAASALRVGYPLVVRPLGPERLAGRKALIVDGPAALAAAVPVWPAGQPALLLQRMVIGRRYNYYFAASRGRLVRVAAADVDRTDSPDGTGLAVTGRTVPIDDRLRGYTTALIERLAYHGVGCAQYIVGAERTTFLELNPRIGGNHAVPEGAGLRLAALAIELAVSDPIDVPTITGRPGIVYAWTHGDLAGLRTAIRRGTVGPLEIIAWAWRAARTCFTADLHLTWRRDDPLPTLIPYARRVPGLRALAERRAAPEALGARPGESNTDLSFEPDTPSK